MYNATVLHLLFKNTHSAGLTPGGQKRLTNKGLLYLFQASLLGCQRLARLFLLGLSESYNLLTKKFGNRFSFTASVKSESRRSDCLTALTLALRLRRQGLKEAKIVRAF